MDTKEVPSVVVALHRDITPQRVQEILLGIEEEGIPHVITHNDEINPLTLAHDAAVASRLGVGVGVALDYVVVTTEKLAPGSPYIARFFNEHPDWDRAVGHNAARIVKRVPLLHYQAHR